eukprot:12986406-Alexandrium_andersonii.AAC.1
MIAIIVHLVPSDRVQSEESAAMLANPSNIDRIAEGADERQQAGSREHKAADRIHEATHPPKHHKASAKH